MWLLTFLVADLCFYVSHWAMHRVRLLWAIHCVHHSAKHYDLTTGVRGSAFGVLAAFPFYAWIPLLGVHPLVFLIVDKLLPYWSVALLGAGVALGALRVVFVVQRALFGLPARYLQGRARRARERQRALDGEPDRGPGRPVAPGLGGGQPSRPPLRTAGHCGVRIQRPGS